MIVPFPEKDFIGKAREDKTYQFEDKVVFDKYLQLIFANAEDVQKLFKDLLQQRSIDEAYGEQLDVIGRIVGQPRELVSLDVYKYFAFLGYPNGETYGSINDPSVGGVFYSEGTPVGGNFILDDNTYRLFIKSKILKNRTASTPEELISFLGYLFNDTNIYLKEGVASATIFFGRQLSPLETNLLSFVSYELGYPSRLIPKTIGVGIEYAYFQNNQFFAFQGIPNAKGFGTFNFDSGYGFDFGEDFSGTGVGSPTIEGGGYFASYIG